MLDTLCMLVYDILWTVSAVYEWCGNHAPFVLIKLAFLNLISPVPKDFLRNAYILYLLIVSV